MAHCPILAVANRFKKITNYKGTRFTFVVAHSAECTKQDCEWFENGCPAHPKKELNST